ncbi:hypothetical protein SUNI508_08051 [Seiridium unicorne]|uniref:Uncharacterized protein n=1 Tax=Seiridium unicorne TaxID=138068 RepID=A0ABR2UV75_9PEZI
MSSPSRQLGLNGDNWTRSQPARPSNSSQRASMPDSFPRIFKFDLTSSEAGSSNDSVTGHSPQPVQISHSSQRTPMPESFPRIFKFDLTSSNAGTSEHSTAGHSSMANASDKASPTPVNEDDHQSDYREMRQIRTSEFPSSPPLLARPGSGLADALPTLGDMDLDLVGEVHAEQDEPQESDELDTDQRSDDFNDDDDDDGTFQPESEPEFSPVATKINTQGKGHKEAPAPTQSEVAKPKAVVKAGASKSSTQKNKAPSPDQDAHDDRDSSPAIPPNRGSEGRSAAESHHNAIVPATQYEQSRPLKASKKRVAKPSFFASESATKAAEVIPSSKSKATNPSSDRPLLHKKVADMNRSKDRALHPEDITDLDKTSELPKETKTGRQTRASAKSHANRKSKSQGEPFVNKPTEANASKPDVQPQSKLADPYDLILVEDEAQDQEPVARGKRGIDAVTKANDEMTRTAPTQAASRAAKRAKPLEGPAELIQATGPNSKKKRAPVAVTSRSTRIAKSHPPGSTQKEVDVVHFDRHIGPIVTQGSAGQQQVDPKISKGNDSPDHDVPGDDGSFRVEMDEHDDTGYHMEISDTKMPDVLNGMASPMEYIARPAQAKLPTISASQNSNPHPKSNTFARELLQQDALLGTSPGKNRDPEDQVILERGKQDRWQAAVDAASNGLADTMHGITDSLLRHLYSKAEVMDKIVDEYKLNGRKIATKFLEREAKEVEKMASATHEECRNLSATFEAASQTTRDLRESFKANQRDLTEIASFSRQRLQSIKDAIKVAKTQIKLI